VITDCGVGVVGQVGLERVGTRRDRVHPLQTRDGVGVQRPARRLDHHRPRVELLADLLHRAVQDLLATVDHEDPVADLLGRVEHVRREDDRLALTVQIVDELAHQAGVDRVEPRERLVEDDQPGGRG
jgi:hypothetical protein